MSSADHMTRARPYRMRRRAENVDDTRRRIVEATVALHGSIGPAATTFMGIAQRAGVTRATVYRHFPDEATLFGACSAHWLAQQRQPDPAAWAAVPDPVARLRLGLTDLYRFYRAGDAMLVRIQHDIDFVPAPHRRRLQKRDVQLTEVLLAAYPPRAQGDRLRAAIGHAVSFWTWRSLCVEHALSDADAVDLMVALARAAHRQ